MVQLTWDHNRLFIKPWVPQLDKYLTVQRKSREGSRVVIFYEPLYFLFPDGLITYGVTFGGLASHVGKSLAELNITYELSVRHEPPSEPQWSPALDGIQLRDSMPEILCTIASAHRGGIIKCPTGYGKTFLLELLVGIYPEDRMLILSGGVSLLATIYDRISKRNPDEKIGRVYDKYCQPDERIVVGSLDSLHKLDINSFDTVFVDECHKAGSPELSAKLHEASMPRLFGFSATPYGRSDDANLYSEALFGPLLYEVKYQDAVRAGSVANIEVILVKGPSRPASDKRKYSVYIEKEYIWNHAGRCMLLAGMAGLFLDTEKVIVFARNVEQAVMIRQYMPGTRLAYSKLAPSRLKKFRAQGLMTSEDVSSPDTDAILEDLQEGRITRVIATGVWEAGIDVPDLTAIVRGDGLAAEIPAIQQSGRGGRVTKVKNKAWVLDVDDVSFANRVRAKKKLYKELGWKIHEVDTLSEAADILHD